MKHCLLKQCLILLIALIGVGMCNKFYNNQNFCFQIQSLIYISAQCGFLGYNTYEIVSYVKNVRYSSVNPEFPCQIALVKGFEKAKLLPGTYYTSKDVNLCRFAERCKLNNLPVKMTGSTITFIGQFPGVIHIEYA